MKYNPVIEAALAWNTNAAEECMKNPAYGAKVNSGEWCAACDMGRPCVCDYDQIARELRPYLLACCKRNWRGQLVLVGDLERAKSRSWGMGEPLHEMLYKISWKVVERLRTR